MSVLQFKKPGFVWSAMYKLFLSFLANKCSPWKVECVCGLHYTSFGNFDLRLILVGNVELGNTGFGNLVALYLKQDCTSKLFFFLLCFFLFFSS